MKYYISMEIRLVGAEFFHAEGRTGRHDEANSRFHNFANSLENKSYHKEAM